MHLKEVIYNGFKSFADRTRVSLEPGMTAIVGPNGCGKSNISDGIRWVLGEQSAKALRGNKMQDVIFEGTDKRKPHSLCEVTLIFTDCEAQLGTDFHEVEITRRVTRDGGSEYRLNGKASRLKDIQRLFMDTGIGQSSYSFMAQGQISQIIDANPTERRHLFEEAAGITKYKSQRKETLNKLNLVDQNLTRITDVIEEVNRQMGTLKRQASKALRFQRIKHRLSHLDLALSGYRHHTLASSIAEQDESIANISKQLSTLNATLGEEELLLESRKSQRQQLAEELQQDQQAIFELRSQKGDAENQVELSQSRRQDYLRRIEETQQELESLHEERLQLAQKEKDSAQTKQEQLSLVGSSDSVLQERSEELSRIQSQFAAKENELRETKQQLLITEGHMTRLRANCTTYEVDLKSYEVKHAGLMEEVVRYRSQIEAAQASLNECRSVLETRLSERAQHDEKENSIKAETKSLTEQFRNQQSQIQEADRNLARTTAQIGVLTSLQERFEGFGEGAKAILSGDLSELISADDYQLLSQAIQVDPQHRIALETLLGEALDVLITPDPQKALQASQYLFEQQLGEAYFHLPLSPNTKPSNELPSGLTPALSCLSTKNAAAQQAAEALLQGSYFVEDMAAFIEYWQQNPQFEFIWAASPQGELIDCRGLLRGGKNKGEDNSFLQRENEITGLQRTSQEQQSTLESLRAQAQELQQKIDNQESKLEQQRQRNTEIAEEISTLKAEERGFTNSSEQGQRDLDRSEKELERFESNRDETESRLAAAQEALQTAESEISSKREHIQALENTLQEIDQERESFREGLTQARLELAEKKQRLEFIDRNLGEVEQLKQDIDLRVTRRSAELAQAQEQITVQDENIEENQIRGEELGKTLEIGVASLEKKRSEHVALEKAIESQEHELSDRLEKRREHEQVLNVKQMQITKDKSQLEFLIDKISTEYDTALEEIDWKQRLWQADEKFEQSVNLEDLEESDEVTLKSKDRRGEPTEEDWQALESTDWTEVESEVKQLRSRIHSIGPVNLGAIEEYVALKERYDFLKNQSDDLWNSKNELIAAIEEINETSKKLFADTFEQIRKNFRYTFDSLFAGGEADLKLLDENDVLDSGIEIVARPPGTRLKSLTLLSGGQKTMTALGLLFAIYMVKPSPFCILDELDAPLDDANVGRFTKMLKDFLKYSQFLVITHNKRTISSANCIYGATMQEKGVTNLVSLKFEQAAAQAETVIGLREGEVIEA